MFLETSGLFFNMTCLDDHSKHFPKCQTTTLFKNKNTTLFSKLLHPNTSIEAHFRHLKILVMIVSHKAGDFGSNRLPLVLQVL